MITIEAKEATEAVGEEVTELSWFVSPGAYFGVVGTGVGVSAGTQEVLHEIERLRLEVAAMKDELDILRTQKPGEPLLVTHLESPAHRLKAPIFCAIYEDEEEVVVRSHELQVTAFGESIPEAIVNFKRELVTYFEELMGTPDEQLGAFLRSTKRLLSSIIRKV